MEITKILRKNMPLFVRRMKVGELVSWTKLNVQQNFYHII